MNNFNAALNDALKYHTEQERAAFERNIDENPFEETNHTVYADWLDEQGDHTEAAFRRSLGKWVKDTYPTVHTGHAHFPFWIHRRMDVPHYLPDGVWEDHLPGADSQFRINHTNSPHQNNPAFISNGLYWATFRNMESAFRSAFFAGRNEVK